MIMARQAVRPTGERVDFAESEIIVSKTDPKGRITYCNDIFVKVSGYTEAETLGQPHSFIRHPDMPRSVFKLLWDRIQTGQEIFAYVKNRTKNGGHYWVLAHVTPSLDGKGQILGYHSNRRFPKASALAAIEPLYKELRAIEEKPDNRKDGLKAAHDRLNAILQEKGLGYDEFVLSL